VPSLVEVLEKVSLFSGLNQRQLKRLARDFKERDFKPGTTPPDTYAPPADAEVPQAEAVPEAQRAVGVGTGGLY